MPLDPIEKVVVDGLEQVKPPKMGLEKLVFGDAVETTYDTEKVEIDVYDGKRGVAGYTARGAKGQTVGLEGWDTIQIKPPLIDENFNITAKDLKIREKGKGNINNSGNQEKKFKVIVNRNIKRLQDRKQRAWNIQIQELLTTGKVTIVELDDKGNKKEPRVEDFKMPDSQKYAVSKSWSDPSADIFKDTEDLDDEIIKNSGVMPEYAIVGKNTLQNMLNNTKIMSLMDKKQINFGKLVKENRGDGLTYWGNLGTKEIFTFTDFDTDGNPIIPVDAYIAGSSEAELDIAYGSIDVIQNEIPQAIEAKIVYEKSVDKVAKSVKNEIKSAKLYCLTQSAAFGCLTTS